MDQQSELRECMSLLELDWLPVALPKLMEFLHRNSAHCLKEERIDVTILNSMIRASERGENESADAVDTLSVLVGLSSNLNTVFQDGLTHSMYARLAAFWQEWGEVLGRNGKRLEDVIEKEGNSWLLDENWPRIWRERGYKHYGWLPSRIVEVPGGEESE
jgi:hypothetical protein